MKRIITIAIALVLTIMMVPAQAAYAVSPPPANPQYGTLQIEYRFAEGEDMTIPQQVVRFGYTYNLVSQTAPVLESDMPLVRTYSYRVEGVLTQEQLDSIKGMPNITITPVNVVSEQEIDIIEVLEKKTNDVDKIPMTTNSFDITVGFAADGTPITDKIELTRTGVTFELNTELGDNGYDEDGLPMGYIATVIYRGVEAVLVPGYYEVNESFMSDEESDVPIYVIVADYQTDQMPPPIDIVLVGGGAGGAGGGPGDTGLTPIEDQQVALQAGEGPADIPNIIQDIADGLVPQGNTEVTGLWSLLSMILCIAGIVIAVLSAVRAFIRINRRYNTETSVILDEKTASANRRGLLLRVLIIVIAAVTFLTWVILDDFSRGVVWVNGNTPIIAVMFAVTVLITIFANVHAKKTIGKITDDEEEVSSTAS